MTRIDCPCDDRSLCPSQEGERICPLCGFDFKDQFLNHDARAQAAQRGLRTKLAPVIHDDSLKDFQVFRDCPEGPEMVVIPAGQFIMGSNKSVDEMPPHPVSIGNRFAIGKYPVTYCNWDAYVWETGGYKPDDGGWGRGWHPVIYVTWYDAQDYIQWINQKTGKSYRLLSEAEWEYAARAGTTTAYSTGESIATDQANFRQEGQYESDGHTTEVDLFAPNPWGLHDIHGNVREWVQDTYMPTYEGAPSDGSAWQSGDGSWRVMRGGSWSSHPDNSRSTDRCGGLSVFRDPYCGFRLARDIP